MSKSRRRSIQNLARKMFGSLLSKEIRGNIQKPLSRPIRFEPLEHRSLMAGDFYGSVWNSNSTIDDQQPLSGSSVAEGEAANDLVAFAKALKDAGVTFFGAAWCPFCNEQKLLFEDGYKYLPFVEVTNPDRTLNSVGVAENITTYPTWEFQNGSRVTGVQTLAQLSQLSGIAIPQSSIPSMDTIPAQTVLIGSPMHVPIDAYDPNGNPLTISVSSSNPSLVSAEVLNGNRSLLIETEGYGNMVFELFESEAQRPTSRIIQLAQSGFFNKTATNQITYHRVIDNFVIQAGDPTGTGSGGSSLGDFDDQYDLDLQHNRTGILSYAKSSDDTNDSQFFITEGPQRNLDFNHSIFGQLVEGEPTREAISEVPVSSGNNKPTTAVVIKSASVFNDTENGMIRLKAVSGQTGTASITVTVTDSEGNSTQQSFNVTVAADNKNSAPFLNDITTPTAVAGAPVQVQLTSQDAEGDAVFYDATVPTGSQYSVNVNNTTGLVTVTPNTGFTGAMTVTVGVRAATTADTVDTFDTQVLTIAAAPVAPTGIDLLEASDSGSSNSDNVTNAGSLSFVVSGTVTGATVELRIGNTVVGTGTASGATTTITTNNIAALGAGTHSIVATQTLNSQRSANSPALQLVFDNVQPVALASGVIPTSANASTPISIDLAHPEEGVGFTYALQNAPAGMTVNATTGVFSWTPTAGQVGARTFDLVMTDLAGNARSQAFTITVGEQALGRISLKLVDSNGNEITSAAVGQNFKLQLFTRDLRSIEQGVFAAFVDLLYSSNIVEVTGTSPIDHGSIYLNTPIGNTSTPGLIDELGGVSAFTAPLGSGSKLLAEVSMRAKAVGQASFTTEPADGSGTQFLVYGVNTAIPSSQVNFGTATLSVGLDFVVTNDSATVAEDSAANSIAVLTNDTVNSGSTSVLSIQSVSTGSAGGTIAVATGSKAITYSPKANFNGTETFTYTATNQSGATAVGTVTVTVTPVNDPPVATNDTVEFTQNSTENVISVLQNDNDGPDDGETLRVTVVGTPSQGGTARITSNGNTITYSPKAGFVGSETITYTIADNGGATSTATINVTVKPSVPPPTAVVDLYTIAEDSASAEFDVLANDTPSQSGETLSITAATATQGVVSVTADGKKITFAPKANFHGSEVVRYTLKGSLGGTTTGTVTFTVTPVNDAPTAVADTLNANSTSNSILLDVLSNDTNVDTGETLTITSVTQPTTGNGTLAISDDKKSIRYTPPNSNFTGSFTFSYTISDGNGLSSTVSSSVQVTAFQPRDIGGEFLVGFDGQNNLATYIPEITFTGTDFNSNLVNRSVAVEDSGFVVNDVAPGNYRIEAPDLLFLQGATSRIEINSAPNDTDSISNQLQLGVLHARYLDIRDFIGNAIGNTLTMAVTPGKVQNWATGQGDWTNFKKLNATLSADGAQIAIVATRSNNQVVQATIPTNDPRKVDVRGTENGARLYQLRMKAAEINFANAAPPTTNGSTASGEGEGEGFAPSLMAMMVAPELEQNSSIDSIESSSSNVETAAIEEAFRQVKPKLEVVSMAGDYIADQGMEKKEDSASREEIFGSVEEVLGVGI